MQERGGKVALVTGAVVKNVEAELGPVAIEGNKREHIFPFILWITVRIFQKAPLLNLWFMKALGRFRPARQR